MIGSSLADTITCDSTNNIQVGGNSFDHGLAGFNECTDSIMDLPSFNLGGRNSITIV
jgi:hypothetical protein